MSANNCLMVFRWGKGYAVQENGCVDNDWKKPRTDKHILFKGSRRECLLWAHKHDDTEYGVELYD